MNDEHLPTQLTIDAAVAVLQNELRHVQQSITDGHIRLEARLEGQARVLSETRDMVREANSKAATALRMADANASDIQAIQEWKKRHDDAVAVVGGTDEAIRKFQRVLNDKHDGQVRRSEWKRIAGWLSAGVTLGLALAKVLYEAGLLPT